MYITRSVIKIGWSWAKSKETWPFWTVHFKVPLFKKKTVLLIFKDSNVMMIWSLSSHYTACPSCKMNSLLLVWHKLAFLAPDVTKLCSALELQAFCVQKEHKGSHLFQYYITDVDRLSYTSTVQSSNASRVFRLSKDNIVSQGTAQVHMA